MNYLADTIKSIRAEAEERTDWDRLYRLEDVIVDEIKWLGKQLRGLGCTRAARLRGLDKAIASDAHFKDLDLNFDWTSSRREWLKRTEREIVETRAVHAELVEGRKALRVHLGLEPRATLR